MKPFDLAVCIGRFQPVHLGHQDMVNHASRLASKVLLVVGTTGKAPTPDNPFTLEQRIKMMFHSLFWSMSSAVRVISVEDHPSDAVWAMHVKEAAEETGDTSNVVLVAGEVHNYQALFTDWAYHVTPRRHSISGTHVRQQLFKAGQVVNVPEPVRRHLEEYMKTKEYRNMKEVA